MKHLYLFLAILMVLVGCAQETAPKKSWETEKQRLIDSLFVDCDRQFAIIDSLQKQNDSIMFNAFKRSSAHLADSIGGYVDTSKMMPLPVETVYVHCPQCSPRVDTVVSTVLRDTCGAGCRYLTEAAVCKVRGHEKTVHFRYLGGDICYLCRWCGREWIEEKSTQIKEIRPPTK